MAESARWVEVKNLRLRVRLQEKRHAQQMKEKKQRLRGLDDQVAAIERKILETDRERGRLEEEIGVVAELYERAC